mmetsp:Transcript_96569/g.282263  ORF Transcript_96569/g.282263 Transcript_96569/m.282263 type:complete len:201 (+) Transcript_96569:361-963(+)
MMSKEPLLDLSSSSRAFRASAERPACCSPRREPPSWTEARSSESSRRCSCDASRAASVATACAEWVSPKASAASPARRPEAWDTAAASASAAARSSRAWRLLASIFSWPSFKRASSTSPCAVAAPSAPDSCSATSLWWAPKLDSFPQTKLLSSMVSLAVSSCSSASASRSSAPCARSACSCASRYFRASAACASSTSCDR